MTMRLHVKKHAGWTRAGIAVTATVIAVLWLTGIVLYAWPSADTAALDAWQAEVRRWAIIIHGSLVWLVCLFAGRWIWPHVGGIWARLRSSTWFIGLATLTLFALVTITGLALLYGPGAAHDWFANAHWWCAVALPAVVGWHAKGLVRRG
jgi:hypothetical protein